LKFAKVDGSFPKLRKQLAAFDLIILDEWLRDALSPNDAREILDFLDDRYRRSSCLLATQFPVNQWHPQIQDPTLADAILDRLVHDSLRLPSKASLCANSPVPSKVRLISRRRTTHGLEIPITVVVINCQLTT
jgi:DNA replication protein DnaC